jgi:hypothetical protein
VKKLDLNTKEFKNYELENQKDSKN